MAARFEREDYMDSLSPRERRRLTNPLADFVWRDGRMFVRPSQAEHVSRRKKGNLGDLALDVWTALHIGPYETVDWFLTQYLGLYPNENRTSEDLWEALHHVIGTRWADRPAQEVHKKPPPWYNPASKNPKGYLYVAVKNEAERRNRNRDAADKPWGHKRLHIENLPKQCELLAEVLEHEDESAEALIEFQRKEIERSMLNQAKGILPERQYQVFALRVEGKSYKEISKELAITVNAAKSNMSHALRNSELRKVAKSWK